MMQKQIQGWLEKIAQSMLSRHGSQQNVSFVVEASRRRSHGDWASNIALVLAKVLRADPRSVACEIVSALRQHDTQGIAKMEVAGAGFINFFVHHDTLSEVLEEVFSAGERYGHAIPQSGKSVLVEFVSANPTGPLHVGHGRGAAYGDSLARLLRAAGCKVDCEYYVNDGGRQIAILVLSVWLHYICARKMPANTYRGGYVKKIAQQLRDHWREDEGHDEHSLCDGCPQGTDDEQCMDFLIRQMHNHLGAERFSALRHFVVERITATIRADLERFRVRYQKWFHETTLLQGDAVRRALTALQERGCVYEKEGALWFAASRYGDGKDRVVVRANGEHTYFAADIAYHYDKIDRGYDKLINIWGADHHGYIARMKAALAAGGIASTRLQVLLVQFATLYRGDEKLSMSTRRGEFVTLEQLCGEVGVDAARFFYLQRKPEQHLNFDVELAKEKSEKNPVYYVQYAHARICALLRRFEQQGGVFTMPSQEALDCLQGPLEQDLLGQIGRFPQRLQSWADEYSVHALAVFLRELAARLHRFYNATPILVDHPAERNARLALVLAVKQVLANGLSILGIAAVEEM